MSLKNPIVLAAGLAIIGFLALMGYGLANKTLPTAGSGAAIVQKQAPDFQLELFDGGEIRLSDLRGQPVVINFWASWCPPCREEAPTLERVWRAYRDKGVVFIGVDIWDIEADARAYLKEFDITYPNGPDPSGQIPIDYGVSGIPVTFFISKEGYVVDRWVGPIDERNLVARVEELMQ